jgi:hypothetical protein
MDDDNIQKEGRDLMIKLGGYYRSLQIGASAMFY